jgi:pyruvate carboxylase
LGAEPSDRLVISWFFYPKVVEDFIRTRQEYGYITRLGSHVFFHGLAEGETNRVHIQDGKRLIIKYVGKGEPDSKGMRNVMFELNGSLREVQIFDESVSATVKKVRMADAEDRRHVSSPIPGMVSQISVSVGDLVSVNSPLLVVEAMKMETGVTANLAGVVKEIIAEQGQRIVPGELLMVIE